MAITMFKTLTLSLITLLLSTPGLAVPPPGKVQPGSDPSLCSHWAEAHMEDSCTRFAKTASPPLDVAGFLALNPQLKGDCNNVWWKYHYCVRSSHTKPRITVAPQITAPPRPVTCKYNKCYNLFEMNAKEDPKGVTTMCDEYLKTERKEKDPVKLLEHVPKPNPPYWWPDHITSECTGDAHLYMSSLCQCYTNAPFISSLGQAHSI